jgi:two-component system response regulator (stage 0 sporulation protein A)
MNIEEKVNAVINYILSETEEEKESAIFVLKNANTRNNGGKGIEEETASVLFEIGMPEHIRGYRYCSYAIKIAVENPEIMSAITGELYPKVAEKFDTTGIRVERAIRHGIECAFDRCDFEITEKYFGSTISALKDKPTNGEFIARIANIVRRRVGKE